MSGTDPAEINMYQWYKCPPPASANAFQIWKECGLSDYAITGQIFLVLDGWMRTNCTLTLQGTTYYVDWRSPTGMRIYATALTFAKWLLCACSPCDPPVPMDSEPIVAEKPETVQELAELLGASEPEPGQSHTAAFGEPEPIHETTLNDFLMGVS